MRPRIEQELVRLRNVYGDDVEHVEEAGEDWFLIPRYVVRSGVALDGEAVESIPIAFLIKADYPGTRPYGFLTAKGVTINGAAPKNVGEPPKPVPFPGNWLHFSWEAKDWKPTDDINAGSNMVSWCWSFAKRLGEGA